MAKNKSTEIWKPVPQYEGFYEVSNRGRVRRIANWKNTWRGRILKQQHRRDGYCELQLCKHNHRSDPILVHTIVLAAFGRARPEGMQTKHKNGCKWDNRANNLEWGTRIQNSHRAYTI